MSFRSIWTNCNGELNTYDETNWSSPEQCLTIRIGQISNSYELNIWLKGIVKHYSYPGMPPQFQALRVPVKQSWEVGTVLAPYKPFSIRSRGSRIPRFAPQSLVRITPKKGGKLYVSLRNLHSADRALILDDFPDNDFSKYLKFYFQNCPTQTCSKRGCFCVKLKNHPYFDNTLFK